VQKLVTALLAGVVLFSGSLVVAADKGGKEKKKDASAAFKRLDVDKDGKLSRDEFAKFGHGKKKDPDRTKLDKGFKRLDTNNDGFLSQEEFKKLFERRKK
jgi:Ca2+-binding EF-hand superfamily protein